MANSLMQIVSDGSLSTIPLTIKFFDQSHIKVFVNNVELPDGTYTFAWSGATTLTITPAVALGAEVSIRRKTPADEVLHDFQAGAVFSEVSVDDNFRQDLFLLQEASEQSLVTDLFDDLDMHGNGIRNVRTATQPGDAINFEQALEIAEGGGAFTLRAELAAINGSDKVNTYEGRLTEVLRSRVPTAYKVAQGSFQLGGTGVSRVSCLFDSVSGMYWVPRNGTIVVGAASSPDANWISVGLGTMPKGRHSLFDFGCIDDNGVTDNRARAQLAIEFMEFTGSELYTNSSEDAAYFGITTFDPLNPLSCLTLRSPRTLHINGGRSRNASIKYTGMLPGNALFSLRTTSHDFGGIVENLGASASSVLDYVLDGHDQWYANIRFTGGCYQEAVLDNIHLSCYMATFERVFANVCGRNGFAFGGPDSAGGWSASTATSINMDNCWARHARNSGFAVANELWYSHWSNTGVDGDPGNKTVWAYAINQAKGVTLAGIGCEQVERILVVGTFRGLTIQGIQASGIGLAVGVADACIQLGGGTDATISGFAPRDAFDSQYTSILKVATPTGNEFVNILDQSITGSKITVVKGGGFYKYPDIVYFARSDSRDSGFLRTSTVLHPGKDFGVFCGMLKEADTILTRTFTLTSTSVISTQFLSVPDATAASDYNAEVEVSCHEEGVAPVKVVAYIVRRSGVSTMTVLSGVFPAAWRLDVFQTVARVITTTVAKKTFIVKVNLVSPTAVVTFKL